MARAARAGAPERPLGRIALLLGVALAALGLAACLQRALPPQAPPAPRSPASPAARRLWIADANSVPAPSDDDPAEAEEPGAAHGNGEEAEGEEQHKHHNVRRLFFLYGGLPIGALLQVLQERYLRRIPYTCLLFLCGFCLAMIHELRPATHWSAWGPWFVSVSAWETVDPHLIFHVFLPILIFAEAMRINIKLATKLFVQILLLAGPGVLVGAALTGAFAKYVFPYEWDWATSLTFGSILAATDPVAVVALFNQLGVSPRLTMLISGESLLNDGTAIVLFELSKSFITGGMEITAINIGRFVILKTVVASLTGAGLALVALAVIAACAETMYHSDAMIQVVVTISVSFLCFFLAEMEVHTSGVLAVVSAGCVVSYAAWPNFASRETMIIVWEAIEFIGNTMIFMLAGLLFGYRFFHRREFLDPVAENFGLLGLLYLAITLIRVVMLVMLWPLLNCVGQRITWQEIVMMTWSGLRGAVGLILAIVVDMEDEIKKRDGSLIMFHVGGVAMLTIVFNATLCPLVVQWLGLATSPEIEKRLEYHFEELSKLNALSLMQKVAKNAPAQAPAQAPASQTTAALPIPSSANKIPRLPTRHSTLTLANLGPQHSIFEGVDIGDVLAMAPSLDSDSPLFTPLVPDVDLSELDPQEVLRTYRTIFMRGVQNKYWHGIDDGSLPRTWRLARILLYSTSAALLSSDSPLHDWDLIQQTIEKYDCPCLFRTLLYRFLQLLPPLQGLLPYPDDGMKMQVHAALFYIDAHEKILREQLAIFEGTVMEDAVKDVLEESTEQVAKARVVIDSMPDEAKYAKATFLAAMLLHKQVEDVERFLKEGLVDNVAADHIAHHIQSEYRNLAGVRMRRPPSLRDFRRHTSGFGALY